MDSSSSSGSSSSSSSSSSSRSSSSSSSISSSSSSLDLFSPQRVLASTIEEDALLIDGSAIRAAAIAAAQELTRNATSTRVNKVPKPKIRRSRGKVQVVTSKGHVLAVYKSRSEAALRTNINHAQIGQVCLGKQARAGGFLFRSADPEAELKQLLIKELQEARLLAVERGEHEDPTRARSYNSESEGVQRRRASLMKKVKVVTSKGHALAVYESQHEASRRTGINPAYVSQVCVGKLPHAKGLVFRLADPEAELNQLSLEELQEAKRLAVERDEHDEAEENGNGSRRRGAGRMKKVQVVTSQGRVLAVYESQIEAAKLTGVNSSYISLVCLGKLPHINGLIFRFDDRGAELNQLSLKELQEAIQGAVDQGEHVVSSKGLISKRKKKVQVITSKGHVLAVYESQSEAARRTGLAQAQIGQVCLGNLARSHGFIFRFAAREAELNPLSFEEFQEAKRLAVERGEHEEEEEDENGAKRRGMGRMKKIQVVTSKGHVLAVYGSQIEAARTVGLTSAYISIVCLGQRAHANGFIFRFADPEAELNHLSLEELQEATRLAVERGEHEEVEEERRKNSHRMKKVQVVTSKGHVLAVYASQGEAAKETGINSAYISAVSLGKRANYRGFIFRSADSEAELNQLSLEELQEAKQLAVERGEHEEVEEEKEKPNWRGKSLMKKIQVVTSKDHVLAVYESQVEAGRRTGINSGSISNVCLGRLAHIKGFMFRFADPEAELNQLSLEELKEAKRLAVERGEHEVGELAPLPTAALAGKRRKRARRELDESDDEEVEEEEEEEEEKLWLDSRPQIHQQIMHFDSSKKRRYRGSYSNNNDDDDDESPPSSHRKDSSSSSHLPMHRLLQQALVGNEQRGEEEEEEEEEEEAVEEEQEEEEQEQEQQAPVGKEEEEEAMVIC